MKHVIVVGSGPAGVAAAKGLIERGCKVTMLDVGNTLEPEKAQHLQSLQSNTRSFASVMEFLRGHANAKNKPKLPFGSDYIYQGVDRYFNWTVQGGYFQPSFAQGGLSNVWGSATAAYTQSELIDWPAAQRDLSPYYAAMINWFGRYYTQDTAKQLSRQANHLLNQWQNYQSFLTQQGFSFKPTVLATDFEQCKLCGACQHSCPYGVIYHSSLHLNLLKTEAQFSYLSQQSVVQFAENAQQVEIAVKNTSNDQVQVHSADHLFVACGAGMSSLLYLKSLNQSGKKLQLKDSQHFMLPCLMSKRLKHIMQDSLHTLSQLSATIADQSVSQYPVHLQFYTYMDLYEQEIKAKLKRLYPLFARWIKPWLERLVVVQGYLDVRESNHLSIEYVGAGDFVIQAQNDQPVKRTVQRVVQYLRSNRQYLGLKPIRSLLSCSLTGQSNHVSGSLCMVEQPQDDEVDVWGCPKTFSRVHFVDASVLPAIPAGPITLTAMANAYRIGKECPL